MLMKNILAAFTLAGLAIASPVEDIQERAQSCFCCANAIPFNILFITKVGSNCKRKPLLLSEISEKPTKIWFSQLRRRCLHGQRANCASMLRQPAAADLCTFLRIYVYFER